MQEKPTPGPWYAEPYKDAWRVVSNVTREVIAQSVSNSNAKLLAEAPRMLATLEAILSRTSCPEDWAQEVAYTIAKARGI